MIQSHLCVSLCCILNSHSIFTFSLFLRARNWKAANDFLFMEFYDGNEIEIHKTNDINDVMHSNAFLSLFFIFIFPWYFYMQDTKRVWDIEKLFVLFDLCTEIFSIHVRFIITKLSFSDQDNIETKLVLKIFNFLKLKFNKNDSSLEHFDKLIVP